MELPQAPGPPSLLTHMGQARGRGAFLGVDNHLAPSSLQWNKIAESRDQRISLFKRGIA